MKRIEIILAALALTACAQNFEDKQPVSGETVQVFGENMAPQNLEKGVANLFVSEDLSDELEAASDEQGNVDLQQTKALSGLPFTAARRLFRPAGKFEARTRAEGLHRWYIVSYDVETSATKAASDMKTIPGVELIEFVPVKKIIGDPVVVSRESSPSAEASPSSSGIPFDDPLASRQWHYYNDGSRQSAVSGCDVNVVPVWENYTTGDEDVIVSVVDEGVDFNHEDLAANMWHNPDEKGDNVYGFNSGSGTTKIVPGDHGTHVAGTIAAVNNNSKGVCGIAGGNSKKKKGGVKIMSCQIFNPDGTSSGSGEEAIKWGADHGAVISQNSWGYTDIKSTPASLKAAVDYFIKYAGIDENGKQTGPMKGGVVIFAAGNDDADYSGNSYDPIINVSSVGPDFKRAYYSNYGSWCDVAAPGGDYKKGAMVYSTLPDNSYGNMQGTSMACPHVSGVAALILSAKKGTGYTAAALEKALVGNVTDISSFNRGYQLGSGLVNAYKAIAGSGGKAPETPTSLKASAKSNNIYISVKVPKDSDDGTPQSILIYYSESRITKTEGLSFASFYTSGLKAGETLEGVIRGLDFDKNYYMVAVACDLAGNMSGMSNQVSVFTTSNNSPVIKVLDGLEATLKPHERVTLRFEVTDEDDHFVHSDLDDSFPGVVFDTLDFTAPKITLNGPDMASGSYKTRLVATDAFGAVASVDLSFTVLENHPPKVVSVLPDQIYSSKAPVTTQVNAGDYFTDEDGETLSYSIDIDDPTVFNMTYAQGSFNLTPLGYGICKVSVTAKDVRSETAVQTFRVLVRDGNAAVDVYPNPVSDYLYVRTSTEASAEISLINSVGAEVVSKSLSISPFEPASLDMRELPSGRYTVVVNYDGQKTTKNIVKL